MKLMDSYFTEPEQQEPKGVNEEELRKLKEELEKVREAQVALAKERDELIRANDSLEKAKSEAEAKAREAAASKTTFSMADVPTNDAQLCIRINEARKEYCRLMAKSFGMPGGCTGYINFLIRKDMNEHSDVASRAEIARGYDIPYESKITKVQETPKQNAQTWEEAYFKSSRR